jgi:hypothetical protein
MDDHRVRDHQDVRRVLESWLAEFEHETAAETTPHEQLCLLLDAVIQEVVWLNRELELLKAQETERNRLRGALEEITRVNPWETAPAKIAREALDGR